MPPRCPPISAPALLLAGCAAVLPGCGADCHEPAGLNGDWDVALTPADDAWRITGLSEAQLAAGEGGRLVAGTWLAAAPRWTLAWAPADDRLQIDIGDTTYEATVSPEEGSCGRFTVAFEGRWAADGGADHDFAFDAELLDLGDALWGSFRYEGSWARPAADGVDAAEGALSVPAGELRGAPAGAGPTG